MIHINHVLLTDFLDWSILERCFFPENIFKLKYHPHLKYFFITTHRDNAALNFILADNNKTATEEEVCSARHQTPIVGTPNSICFGIWELSLEGMMWYTYLDPLRLSEGELPRPAAADVSESIKAFTLRGVLIGVLISFLSVAPTTQVKILQTYNRVKCSKSIHSSHGFNNHYTVFFWLSFLFQEGICGKFEVYVLTI